MGATYGIMWCYVVAYCLTKTVDMGTEDIRKLVWD